jgi:hypothetical protein
VVNKFDVAALAQGYSGLAGYVGWSDGDYTYPSYISKLDISLLAQSYVFQGAPLGDAITAGQAQYLLALDPDMSGGVEAEFNAIAAGLRSRLVWRCCVRRESGCFAGGAALGHSAIRAACPTCQRLLVSSRAFILDAPH